MARLPSEQYLMQQTDGVVRLFEDFTEDEIARFDPASKEDTARARLAISASKLDGQDKAFAHFWAGYFALHAGHEGPQERTLVDNDENGEVVFKYVTGKEIVRYDPSDGNATAQAQLSIHDSGLAPDQKSLAHFWSGFYWGMNS